MNRPKHFAGKSATVVLDGLGLHPKTEWEIVSTMWDRLTPELREKMTRILGNEELATAAMAPTSHGVARAWSDRTGGDWLELFTQIRQARCTLRTSIGDELFHQLTDEIRVQVAEELHYAPWAVNTPYIFSLRQNRPTWITRTAGVFTGQEAMEPEIMGNSDTGHQQLFNLTVARQVPRQIGDLIKTGQFFENEALNRDLSQAGKNGLVVFKTLLSGEYGDDGFVHSAWPHMEAFFKLYFERLSLPPENLQVEAVLDGRDSPGDSSLVSKKLDGRERYGFLHKLRTLLKKYNAESSLSWILGRQFMDRDYKGGMIQVEYDTVVKNEGRKVHSLDGAFELIAQDHEGGKTDPMITPIIVGNPRTVGENTVFFNAIYRADRQEPITAALMGLTEFIWKQATQKKKLDTWDDFHWITPFKSLVMWSMIEYHSDFGDAGAHMVIHNEPHPHNVLYLLNKKYPDFRFLFLTEGVKEKHMGLFSRGRRSRPLEPSETQIIVPSYGKSEGIASDDDLYQVPQMRHPEITRELSAALTSNKYNVIAANFPGTDMIGHLVVNHFDACQKAILSLETALADFVPVAINNDWVLVITSDHGNIEHYGPDHGNNDVLTTIILPEDSPLEASQPPGYQARLFDISMTTLTALGVTPKEINAPEIPQNLKDDPNRLVAVPLVK